MEQFVAVDGAHAAAEALQVRSLGDAKRSLGYAYILLGGR